MEDPVEVALRKFFPCRLGEYNVELEDGDSEAFQPIADQREVWRPGGSYLTYDHMRGYDPTSLRA